MSLRLLSFLTDIERALVADEPSPKGAAWENIRTVNYHHGLARLALSARRNSELAEPLGAVLVQSFRLADGTICLKAYLSWTGSPSHIVHAIYERPDGDWKSEARRISATWLEGCANAAAEHASSEERMAVAG